MPARTYDNDGALVSGDAITWVKRVSAAGVVDAEQKGYLRAPGGSGGGGGFSPSELSGLDVWLNAKTITGLSDDDPIATWTDDSGEGNDATQGTGSHQPLYKASILNGNPGVRADGVDDHMEIDASAAQKPFTLAYVATKNSGSSIVGASAIGGVQVKELTGSNQCALLKAQVAQIAGSNNVITSPGIRVITYDGSGNLSFRLNGSDDGSATNDVAFDASTLRLFATENAGVVDLGEFDLGELVRVNRVLSASEIEDLEAYLSNEWGVSI